MPDPPSDTVQAIFDEMLGKNMPDPRTMPACHCRACLHLRNELGQRAWGRDTWEREHCRCYEGGLTDDLDTEHYCAHYSEVRRP